MAGSAFPHGHRPLCFLLSAGGGYVMDPAKPILPGVPLENAVALIDGFVEQEK